MQALGLIETKGVLAAIVSVDNMLKAADVNLVDKTRVGGGLVSVAITGDVAAVQVAVDAGAAAVKTIDNSLLVSQHVIPRPQEDLKNKIISTEPLIDKVTSEESKVEDKKENTKEEIVKEEKTVDIKKDVDKINKKEEKEPKEKKEEFSSNNKFDISKIKLKNIKSKKSVDNIVNKYGLEPAIEVLNKIRVVELRKLARKYDDFGIKGREISNAGKKLLITEFEKYYKK